MVWLDLVILEYAWRAQYYSALELVAFLLLRSTNALVGEYEQYLHSRDQLLRITSNTDKHNISLSKKPG